MSEDALTGAALVVGLVVAIAVAFAKKRKPTDDWTSLEGDDAFDDGLTAQGLPGPEWIEDGPSELAGFTTQWVRDTAPIAFGAITVRAGERLHLQVLQTDKGRQVLAQVAQGYVSLRADDVPPDLRAPWRRPQGETPVARLVRALWSDLDVHHDTRIERALSGPPDLDRTATYESALRLAAGVRAVAGSEAALVAWLAAPAPALETRGVPARVDRALRADLLLRFFGEAEVHQAAVHAVATAEQHAPERPLRARALLQLDAGAPLLELALAATLPEALHRAALRAGVGWALAQGNEAAVDRALGHPEVVRAEADWLAGAVARAPALPGPAGAAGVPGSGGAAGAPEAWSPAALQRRAFLQLADRARDLGSLYATFADTPPDDAIHLIALSALDAGVAHAACERLLAALGPAALAERTLRALAEGARAGANAAPVAARSGPVARTLRRIGPHCGAEHLAALRSWATAQTPAGEPDRPVQEAAQAAFEALRRRLPPELAGGLALAAGEAGALSPAEPTAAEPTAAEPTAAEPTATDPTATEPTATDPTATDPTPTP